MHFFLSFLSSPLAHFTHTYIHTHTRPTNVQTIFTYYKFSPDRIIPPDSLRSALSSLYVTESKFQIGEMVSAAHITHAYVYVHIFKHTHIHTHTHTHTHVYSKHNIIHIQIQQEENDEQNPTGQNHTSASSASD